MNKKKLIIVVLAALVFVVALNTFIFVVAWNREGVLGFSGTGNDMSSTRFENGFSVNAQYISGSHRIHLNFYTSNLSNLQIRSTNTAGQIFIELTQGNVIRRTDITGNFNGSIDTNAFEPGRVTVRVIYERAEEINFSASWGGKLGRVLVVYSEFISQLSM